VNFERVPFGFGLQVFNFPKSASLTVPTAKVLTLQVNSETRIGDLQNVAANICDIISTDYADHVPRRQCIHGVFRQLTACPLGTKM
jgi:hypothetical protein